MADAEYDLIVIGAGVAGMTAALVGAIEGARVAAGAYLDALVGEKADRRLRQAFLAAGPSMIGYLEKHAGFVFRPYPHHPDYRQELPGAALGGRPLESPAFDGRLPPWRVRALGHRRRFREGRQCL